MVQKYLGALILNVVIIACVIFVSCGDEGEVVKPDPPTPQQPSPGELTLEPSTPQPAEQTPQPGEQTPQPPAQPQPGGQMPEPPPRQQPQPVEQQPQPEPPRVEQMPQPEPQPQPEPEPPVALPGLPEDTAGYEGWLKLNAQPIPPVPGFDPHRGTKNVYVNQTREVIAPNGQQQFPYPDGAIVVKDAVRPDKDFIGLVAVMWKIAGSNPAAGDWKFEEYTRNAPDAEFRLIASGAACSGCHAGAAATDFVFVVLE